MDENVALFFKIAAKSSGGNCDDVPAHRFMGDNVELQMLSKVRLVSLVT